MTATVGSPLAHDPPASDFYDPDEVIPQNSPLMKAHRPKLEPSPSPPAIPLPKVSPPPSSNRKSSNRRQKIRPSLGDAVLIHYLDGGKRPEIVAEAWSRPLAQYEDDDQSKGDSEESADESGHEEDTRSHEMSPGPTPRRSTRAAETSGSGNADLQFLATNAVGMLAAVNAASKTIDPDTSRHSDDAAGHARRVTPSQALKINGARDDGALKDLNRPVLAPPISPYPSQPTPEVYSPPSYTSGQVLMHPNNVRSPPSLTASSHGELPPIHAPSPNLDPTSHDSLPPIRAQLVDQFRDHPKELALRHGPQFPHSPPGAPPHIGRMPGSHASPPISPNEGFHQSMSSPHGVGMSPYYHPGASNAGYHRAGLDYSSSSNADTPAVENASTPATSITDRMSIDNMTNPVGVFVCTVQGCNAPPFQTQYLLNSHLNVHSSARPHYCPVKGCPRSEGGKGFKRKNEMIRHGLVHDSPGYVCPFCPDREHKYPRPDNLQRHVRVHHVDKDKDDPLLRDVLSQRPDGPNRGRRRRGGP
ncbi:hypothetical protein GGS23DRAFT_605239 [Durotheca rogersii]|uniref:uncharacterized protein n=1 Tax=Durotheca rogersii TaxID=419775 RepID=UPI00221EC8D9|nr:uncharacterized protein GGS23DRAFT_605239 [Durotheca rogersii]KAI5863195.1 hypothetical protein GGS23DRAFT_605239 [Durotheca rogersii]